MVAGQNGEAIDKFQHRDPSSTGREEVTEYRRGGLRQRLGRSYQYMALLGLGGLLIMLVASLWVRSHTLHLAHLRGPTARTSTLALSGVERSLAALRGWMLLGEPDFKVARSHAWNEVVWPALAELERLSHDWTQPENNRRLTEVTHTLETLHGVQWWIEDVAQTPGNTPAREITHRVLRPACDTILAAIDAMIELEINSGLMDQVIWPANNTTFAVSSGVMELESGPEYDVDRKMLLGLMVDMHNVFTQARVALHDLTERTHGVDTSTYRTALHTAMAHLAALQRANHVLYPPQREQLARIQHGLRAHQVFAEEVLAIVRSGRRNVASDLLASDAIPRRKKQVRSCKRCPRPKTNSCGRMQAL